MNPTSSSSALSVQDQLALAMVSKANRNAEAQGQAAVKLIEASEPAKATAGPVGTRLHVVA